MGGIIESAMHIVNEWTELCIYEWMYVHLYVLLQGLVKILCCSNLVLAVALKN